VPEFRYLPQPRIRELLQAFVDAGMDTQRKLDSLEGDINRQFIASLDTGGSPLDRLMTTLNALNRVERLVDGTVPFLQWLGAAEMVMSAVEQVKVVREALRDAGQGGVKAPDVQTHPAPAGFERTKDSARTDMLPFDFLTRGAIAGRAVARLQVPSFQGGQPVILNGKPKMYLGTGWLLTSDLLITNHHVVNARDDDEANAAEPDLRLQAAKTVAQFDYENPDAASVSEAVAELAAWAPLDGALDYAFLRLAETQGATRPPLRLQREPMKLPPDVADYPALNIVQHPMGGPKMVAFRNNQVVQVIQGDLEYYTDTQRGSSGAPVLDDAWRVVALHKKWTWATGLNYQGKSASWVNVGTQVASILADLAAKGSPLLAEILGQG